MQKRERREIFRLFARGYAPEAVAEMLRDSRRGETQARPTVMRVERLFQEYLLLSLGEKLQITLRAEHVSNRTHRLIDDISDLARIDTLLAKADTKMSIPLLDLKRKIKERMATEFPHEAERVEDAEEDADEIARLYERVFNCSRPPD
jgi:hypothetical protein